MKTRTSISISKTLLAEVEALAKKQRLSRSQIFATAVEEYLRRLENQHLLEALNAAYAKGPSGDEAQLLQAAQRAQRQVTERW